MNITTTTNAPIVLIVGAGLGGLMLGALLEKLDVPYMILERATTVKLLGSAMSIGPTLLPIFQQLGIYDDIVAASKYMTHVEIYNENLESLQRSDYRPIEEFTGYGHYIIARPKYYEIMLKQVPSHKVHFGKRVLDISEKDDKVTVHLANNETVEGDIVVGADGAYSAVCERLYEQLKTKGELPEGDQEDLPFSCSCLVGQTKVLDPEEFPIVKNPISQFRTIIGREKPFSWGLMSTAQNTLCWSVIHCLSKKTTKEAVEQRFRNSENSGEWGATPAQTMCDETRDYPLQLGDEKKRTMGDLYDLTPKELISKVALEEKVFKTWYYGRVALMGDACHKLNPSGGHDRCFVCQFLAMENEDSSAVTAMHDAVALANLIYSMPTKTSTDIGNIFKEYQEERYPAVMESFENSQLMSKITARGITSAIILCMVTYMPFWLWKKAIGFLPAIPYMGSVAPFVSASEQKARAFFEKQQNGATSV
ncbi:FAD/NAD(P)-binding domain-containing protein [Linnemannia elongata AG-77]|uniref:FAD/NAD(P)-binding domain-containing protein n=1 Tax=Linnemannia elongata AG-77 TaxID=1314771 RepID=A0A197JXI7_9FUNG|nr:FAD/NAD(P)-binding domain-containing protein [Linnemannia elongata AG-77]